MESVWIPENTAQKIRVAAQIKSTGGEITAPLCAAWRISIATLAFVWGVSAKRASVGSMESVFPLRSAPKSALRCAPQHVLRECTTPSAEVSARTPAPPIRNARDLSRNARKVASAGKKMR